MRTHAIFLALLLAVGTAAAAPGLGTVRFGDRVLVEGDNVARVYEVAGKPDRIVQLENRFGAGVGERWEYYRDGKAIMLEVSGGRIVRIDVVNN